MNSQNIVIIKYNAGNIRSVKNALYHLGVDAVITSDPEKIVKADKVIFPGVGEALTTMKYLNSSGLSDTIKSLTQPLLGICLGMQLMGKYSEEGSVDCMGIFDENINRFQIPADNSLNMKIPHMGWNRIFDIKCDIIPSQLENEFVYFVHSYFVPLGVDTAGVTDYFGRFSSVLQKDNFFATQFHPEKSGIVGQQILKRFIEL
ncbi:imidazole glycerol phosphate synthase subunit HisH [Marinilabiliaceae bacterium ANBcel2]|nr:imidazole glycerol phosphate synthase subunit HisH [Marinilabiliaceae bacterium ANBcel2]